MRERLCCTVHTDKDLSDVSFFFKVKSCDSICRKIAPVLSISRVTSCYTLLYKMHKLVISSAYTPIGGGGYSAKCLDTPHLRI